MGIHIMKAQYAPVMRILPPNTPPGGPPMTLPRSKPTHGLSRRTFIRGTATAFAGFTIVPRHVLGGAGFVPPSEKVNIAIIGCGGQGRTNIPLLLRQSDAPILPASRPIYSPH